MHVEQTVPINKWSEDERPRERLLHLGQTALSDAELLTIIIGTGTKSRSALDLAREVLKLANQNLIQLSRLTAHDLMQIKGIGQAKAINLLAAIELGRRRREADVLLLEKVTSSKDVFEYMQRMLSDKQYEEFWCVFLNKANKIIGRSCISNGGVAGTVVDQKKVFSMAIQHKASSLIVCHNHPSGNTMPSEADKTLTGKLVQSGKLLDILVLDHLIICEEKYFSFADEGML